jgi:hypothetical protein
LQWLHVLNVYILTLWGIFKLLESFFLKYTSSSVHVKFIVGMESMRKRKWSLL